MSRPLFGSVLLASIGATLVLAAPASAQVVERFSSEVRYGDLNLTTDAGVAALHRRIANAARQACGYSDSRDLKVRQAVANCQQAALADATPKIELAVANARNGQAYAANAAVKVGTPARR
jgi:UrcA family protein